MRVERDERGAGGGGRGVGVVLKGLSSAVLDSSPRDSYSFNGIWKVVKLLYRVTIPYFW